MSMLWIIKNTKKANMIDVCLMCIMLVWMSYSSCYLFIFTDITNYLHHSLYNDNTYTLIWYLFKMIYFPLLSNLFKNVLHTNFNIHSIMKYILYVVSNCYIIMILLMPFFYISTDQTCNLSWIYTHLNREIRLLCR